jgi:hypothetical protein
VPYGFGRLFALFLVAYTLEAGTTQNFSFDIIYETSHMRLERLPFLSLRSSVIAINIAIVNALERKITETAGRKN